MKNGSILIISNDEKTGNLISEKVKLLRDCDSIQIVTYIESISVLNSTQPSLIMVYSSSSDSIGIVKEIRTLKNLDKVPIILVMDYFIEELLLYAFDNGIDDFFFMNDSDAIILMRIILTLQKSILYKQIEIKNDILTTAGIVDKETGIYTKEQAPLALKHFFSKSIEENLENTVFMCIKPIAIQNKKLNMQKIASIIKKVPRGNDITAYGKSSAFYMILYNAGAVGSKSVFTRIKNSLSEECEIYSNAAEITASFEEMEPVLLQSLKDQISAGIEFSYLYNLTLSEAVDIMDIHDETGKKFKDFKKEFFNAIEKMITPAFYEIKTKSEEIIPDAKIDFDITETESRFTISSDKIKSEILITYPSYMKLIIDIKHIIGVGHPQVRRLTFDFEDFSSDNLLSILKDVIKEFSDRINKTESENVTE